MSAVNLKAKRPIEQLTAEDLREIVRTAVQDALHDQVTSVRVDPRGILIFPNESQYAAYLKTQPGKLPSEFNACFIDSQGFRVRYSDYEPTPKKTRELKKRGKEPTVPAEVVWEELRKLGVE